LGLQDACFLALLCRANPQTQYSAPAAASYMLPSILLHSPAGQPSRPPCESTLRRDPEVNLDSPARPRQVRLLPGRGRAAYAVVEETAAMAAPRQVSSRSVPREEPVGSANSSVTNPTPVPTVSPVSLERPVSPGQVAEPPGKTLWEQICEGRQPGWPRGAGPGGRRPGSRSPSAHCSPGG
jgi:hypothetical protein